MVRGRKGISISDKVINSVNNQQVGEVSALSAPVQLCNEQLCNEHVVVDENTGGTPDTEGLLEQAVHPDR